jgi:MFS family permease
MQNTAMGWLVWRLTGDTFMTGLVAACNFIPVFLLGPFAGPVADRVDRRKLLLVVISIEMLVALLLGGLILAGLNSVWPVIGLALILGCCTSFNYAAQAAFIGDLSGIGELRKAMTFNVIMIETGRLVGPALAGIVVDSLGLAVAFWLNGISFVAVLASLLVVRAQQVRRAAHGQPLAEFAEALRFIRSQPRIFDLVACNLAIMLFIFSSMQLNAPIADVVLQGGPRLLGFMGAASGAGALVSAFIIAPLMQRVARAGVALCLAALWSGVWLVIASFFATPALYLAGIFCFSIGIPLVLGNVNALKQMMTPPDMRGRVLSATQMVSFGVQPLSALLVGWMASVIGPLNAVLVNGILMIVFALTLLLARRGFREWVVARAAA